MRAWKGTQKLPLDEFNSFFLIASYHAEPFVARAGALPVFGEATANTTTCCSRSTSCLSLRARKCGEQHSGV
jgi:hypothetical protein